MIYVLLYLWLGVITTGFYHVGCKNSKIPVSPTNRDYFLVTLFWPIPVFIVIFTILSDLRYK